MASLLCTVFMDLGINFLALFFLCCSWRLTTYHLSLPCCAVSPCLCFESDHESHAKISKRIEELQTQMPYCKPELGTSNGIFFYLCSLSFAEAPQCQIEDAHKLTLYKCDNMALYSCYSIFKDFFFFWLEFSVLPGSAYISFSLSLRNGVYRK